MPVYDDFMLSGFGGFHDVSFLDCRVKRLLAQTLDGVVVDRRPIDNEDLFMSDAWVRIWSNTQREWIETCLTFQ